MADVVFGSDLFSPADENGVSAMRVAAGQSRRAILGSHDALDTPASAPSAAPSFILSKVYNRIATHREESSATTRY